MNKKINIKVLVKEIREIEDLLKKGKTVREIAEVFGKSVFWVQARCNEKHEPKSLTVRIAEAEKIRELIKNKRLSIAEIAEELNRGEKWVRSRIFYNANREETKNIKTIVAEIESAEYHAKQFTMEERNALKILGVLEQGVSICVSAYKHTVDSNMFFDIWQRNNKHMKHFVGLLVNLCMLCKKSKYPVSYISRDQLFKFCSDFFGILQQSYERRGLRRFYVNQIDSGYALSVFQDWIDSSFGSVGVYLGTFIPQTPNPAKKVQAEHSRKSLSALLQERAPLKPVFDSRMRQVEMQGFGGKTYHFNFGGDLIDVLSEEKEG
jgi:DNA-binding Lrp family transcriptional regulator